MSDPPPEPRVLLLLVMGLPGAGKSTWLRRWVKQASPSPTHALTVISFDEIERSLHEGGEVREFDQAKWKEARGIAYQRAEEAVVRAKASVEAGKTHVIALDDNFYLRSMRKPFFQLAREHQTQFAYVWVHLPSPFDLYARNEGRAGYAAVPAFVIDHMTERFEWPGAITREDSKNTPWDASVPLALVDNSYPRHLYDEEGSDIDVDLYARRGEDSVLVEAKGGSGVWQALVGFFEERRFVPAQVVEEAREEPKTLVKLAEESMRKVVRAFLQGAEGEDPTDPKVVARKKMGGAVAALKKECLLRVQESAWRGEEEVEECLLGFANALRGLL